MARKYNGKQSDATSLEISELSLDMIQTWGEAFLPRSREYPNIPKLYHELRKDGLPFRAQYDESRVPVFTPPPAIPDDLEGEGEYGGGGAGGQLGGDIDADLAAAMALSLAESGPPDRAAGVSSAESSVSYAPRSRSQSSADCLSSCQSTVDILREIVMSSSSAAELHANEILDEVAAQLRTQRASLMTAIEEELGTDGPVGTLFTFSSCRPLTHFLCCLLCRMWRSCSK